MLQNKYDCFECSWRGASYRVGDRIASAQWWHPSRPERSPSSSMGQFLKHPPGVVKGKNRPETVDCVGAFLLDPYWMTWKMLYYMATFGCLALGARWVAFGALWPPSSSIESLKRRHGWSWLKGWLEVLSFLEDHPVICAVFSGLVMSVQRIDVEVVLDLDVYMLRPLIFSSFSTVSDFCLRDPPVIFHDFRYALGLLPRFHCSGRSWLRPRTARSGQQMWFLRSTTS